MDVFVIIFIIIVISLIIWVEIWKKKQRQNPIEEEATVIKTDVLSCDSVIPTLSVTFELKDGSRQALRVSEAEFGKILVGDRGLLAHRNGVFSSFTPLKPDP